MPVAIIVQEGAAGAPANVLVMETRSFRHVRERSVAVVAEEHVVAPEAAEQVIPSVVVVIADAHAGLPAGAANSGFFRDVAECSVAVVLVEMRRRRFPGGPVLAEQSSVCDVDIQPAVVVVIEKCDP